MFQSGATLLCTVLIGATGGQPETAGHVTPHTACGSITDTAALPSPLLESSESAPVACRRVLRCVRTARSRAGISGGSAGGSIASACAAVEPLTHLGRPALELLLSADLGTTEATLSLPPGICHRFLRCLADALDNTENRPRETSETAPDWKAEFDRICAQVPIAGSLTTEQLRQLVADCKRLTEQLRASAEPQTKVLTKRLQMCQSFFGYTLESRERKPKESGR